MEDFYGLFQNSYNWGDQIIKRLLATLEIKEGISARTLGVITERIFAGLVALAKQPSGSKLASLVTQLPMLDAQEAQELALKIGADVAARRLVSPQPTPQTPPADLRSQLSKYTADFIITSCAGLLLGYCVMPGQPLTYLLSAETLNFMVKNHLKVQLSPQLTPIITTTLNQLRLLSASAGAPPEETQTRWLEIAPEFAERFASSFESSFRKTLGDEVGSTATPSRPSAPLGTLDTETQGPWLEIAPEFVANFTQAFNRALQSTPLIEQALSNNSDPELIQEKPPREIPKPSI